jgi:hypothetical protein
MRWCLASTNTIFGDMRGQVWQGQKITLTSGVCLQAVGSGQSLRGIKHYDFRPDCLLLDDFEGDVGASTPLEREDTKKWFFGTVLPSLASRSIIRLAATPLDQECLPVTLGKMPTWKTMVVPVRNMGGNEDAFFESWCAEQGVDVAGDATSRGLETSARWTPDQSRSRTLDKIKQLVAANERPRGSTSIDDLPHVAEEQHPAKSFDLVHGGDRERVAEPPKAAPAADVVKKPPSETQTAANAERQRRYRERKKAGVRGVQTIPESKSETPAPSPEIDPETRQELSEIEKAMRWRAPDRYRQ